MPTLYTIDCPKCKVLEMKLSMAGIRYHRVDDRDTLKEMGLDYFPILEVDGEKLDFSQALQWIKEVNGEHQY